ncbi:hypothetical protein GJ744_010694 [Endocarpon pusillum]|uniref:Uncharacterized protein n=1 Tax=Endocarpon pusillum TaxID=364733 RepID=A0A8H7AGC4_9EURO|nr:hypothetical protein GJ744_010694 [Endocarpon pusillum]
MSLSDDKLKEIKDVVGSAADWEQPSDYIRRLKEATGSDSNLRQYVRWVASQDVKRLPCQCPIDWLHELYKLDYSSIPEVVDIRSALSFGEVDYITLATEGTHGHDNFYIVKSDPSALGPVQQPEKAPPLSSGNITTHPALIRLLFENLDSNRPVPSFVLPIGRMLRIVKPYGVVDSDVMQQVADIYVKNSKSLEEFALDAWHSICPISSEAEFRPHRDAAIITYVKEIASKLDAGLEPSALGHDQDIERCRREAWRAISQNPRSFLVTEYAVVVDAVDQHHPVWLVRRRNQQDDFGDWKFHDDPADLEPPFTKRISPGFDAAQIFKEISDWPKYYSGRSSYEFSDIIRRTRIRGRLTVHATDVKVFSQAVPSHGKRKLL